MVLWEGIVGPLLVSFGSTVGAGQRIWRNLACVSGWGTIAHACSLAFFLVNKANHVKRWVAQHVKLRPGSCLPSSLTSVQWGKQGHRQAWAAEQVGQKGNRTWRGGSRWIVSTLGKLESKPFWIVETQEPCGQNHQAPCSQWCAVQAALHLLETVWWEEDTDSSFSSALICLQP